jgi:hypothetical protein
MNSLIQLNRQLRFLLITLLLASFAVVQSVQAEPNEADPIGTVAEEDNALLDLNAETENVEEGNATLDFGAQAGNAVLVGKPVKGKPNEWMIKIDFTKFVMCAMENVHFVGELRVKFKRDGGSVRATEFRLKGQVPGEPFSAKGTGKKPLGRTYDLPDVTGKGFNRKHEITVNNSGHACVGRKFEFIARPNPPLQGNVTPGKQIKFTLEWAPPVYDSDGKLLKDGELSWEWQNGTVKSLKARFPEINCPRR